MADDGFNVCEYFWNYDIMQRLLSLLRHTQNYCTDNECLTLDNLPGPEGDQSNPDFLFIGIAFVAMTLLYLFRPNSLRQSYGNDWKPQTNSSGLNNDDPPAPPPPSMN